jgi:ligand-binding sensor domain-containing protein
MSSCETFDEDATDPALVNRWENYSVNNGLSDNFIYTIFKDKSGNLWVGTDQGGVNHYNGSGWTSYTLNNGLLSNRVYAVGQDKDGDIWFGTSAGANILFNGEVYYYEYLEGMPIYSFLKGKDDLFWIGTGGYGIVLYDYQEFVPLTSENADHNYINSMILDKSGTVWIGTDGGVLYYDGEVFDIYDESGGLNHNRVTDILQDSWGDLWFSSFQGEFLTRYDGQNAEYISLFNGSTVAGVWSMVEDLNRNNWFATGGNGIVKYNGAEMTTMTLPSQFEDHRILCAELDHEGNLWFGTVESGIYIYITE